jgi:hypothetical protein
MHVNLYAWMLVECDGKHYFGRGEGARKWAGIEHANDERALR